MAEEKNKAYRFSIDDNIWFLRDLALNASAYKSIFDNKYLGFFKSVHDLYGTKVHFNIYFETDGFNLTEMPACFKDEWLENADWIRLTFHALADKPSYPYKNAPYQKVYDECNLVTKQIIRFAGEKLLSPFTTLHFVEATREGCKALRDCGYSGLVGLFRIKDHKSELSYFLNDSDVEFLQQHSFLKNAETGLIFVKNDLVLNNLRREDIITHLQHKKSTIKDKDFFEIMIHEQYFHPSYSAYQPDFCEKVLDAVGWLTGQSYQPVFLEDIFKYEFKPPEIY